MYEQVPGPYLSAPCFRVDLGTTTGLIGYSVIEPFSSSISTVDIVESIKQKIVLALGTL